MKTVRDQGCQRGFSIMELLVAMMITMIVMASVFTLLQKGQTSFQREPEVADMQQSVRTGLDMIGRDLALAGFGERTPVMLSIVPADGDGGAGGTTPDRIVIIFDVGDFPTIFPGPPFGPLGNSSTAKTDPTTFLPERLEADYKSAYSEGDILTGIETGDCNGDGEIAIVPFELTQDPKCTGKNCANLNLNHNPGKSESGYNRPQGFDNELEGNCTVFGVFSVIEYRINPLPPAANPTLERRDLGAKEDWTPVARNIENLQVQYALGTTNVFVDNPAMPIQADPTTWITQVRVRLDGTSESTDLQGASVGDFADGNRLRKTFATTVVLRNITAKLAVADIDADGKPDNSYN